MICHNAVVCKGKLPLLNKVGFSKKFSHPSTKGVHICMIKFYFLELETSVIKKKIIKISRKSAKKKKMSHAYECHHMYNFILFVIRFQEEALNLTNTPLCEHGATSATLCDVMGPTSCDCGGPTCPT